MCNLSQGIEERSLRLHSVYRKQKVKVKPPGL